MPLILNTISSSSLSECVAGETVLLVIGYNLFLLSFAYYTDDQVYI